jgi:hypothetical protein
MSATALTLRVVSFSFMAATAGKILGLFAVLCRFCLASLATVETQTIGS